MYQDSQRRQRTEKKIRRIEVTLSCLVCGSRNYKTTKAAADGTDPLVLKKHCKHCNSHTEHREGK